MTTEPAGDPAADAVTGPERPAVPATTAPVSRDERLRRWRLALGGGEADGTGMALGRRDGAVDAALAALYDPERRGGLGASSPRVARWLGDIRTYFPTSVVQVLQRDAMERLGLRRLLLEPEVLDAVQPDVNLVATLVGLNQVIPDRSRETARQVVRTVVAELEQRLAPRTRQALSGALQRTTRTRRPRHGDIDWDRTIRANLRHYRPELGTVVPERLVGFGRKLPEVQREIVLCIDQSGSMAASVVYASVYAAVLASVRAVRTRLVVFDTEVVDLTDVVADPVEVLFGVRLGGGTDIGAALAYCQARVTRPRDTVLVLISDLLEGGVREQMLARVAALVADGMTVVALLALSDEGSPVYDHENAAALADLGVPAFACTPDQFPELVAAAIERRDLGQWAAANEIVTASPLAPET